MRKVSVVLCILGVSLLFGGQIVWAGNPFFSNVTANALCTVDGTDVLVDAGLIQKDVPSSGPVVDQVTFFLEQHFPKRSGWESIAASFVTVDFDPNEVFDLLPAGERYEVATHDYLDACSLVDGSANAVRAVVQITVLNANTKRPGGQVLTGRCISFPNPCR